jgi:2-polyprenyl-6-methoxyphenol hydroxylase-like FAD-dependent oxidoreductase
VSNSPAVKVAVIGAGPTGLTLAYVLARAGVCVSIVDRAPGPDRESSRATTVHAGTLEVLDSLDGLGQAIAEAGAWARQSYLWAGRRRLATLYWERMPTKYAALINLPQEELEGIVRRRLESLGVAVEWNREVQTADEVDASYVVGCDGAHSAIRRSMGVELAGTTYDDRFVLADLDVSTDIDTGCTHIWVSTAGILALMPMPGGEFRLNGTLADDESCDPVALADFVRRRLGSAHERVVLRGVNWVAEYCTHSRLASSYQRGNVFLAGDAAHLNSPVGGQGMNVGIGDAVNLGTKFAAVHGGASPEILDRYEAERRPVAEDVLAATRRGTAMLTCRKPVERFLRNQFMRVAHRLPPVQHQLTTEAAFLAQGGRQGANSQRGGASSSLPLL